MVTEKKVILLCPAAFAKYFPQGYGYLGEEEEDREKYTVEKIWYRSDAMLVFAEWKSESNDTVITRTPVWEIEPAFCDGELIGYQLMLEDEPIFVNAV